MTEQNRPTAGLVVATFGKVAAYLALFLGMQTLVVLLYTSVVTAQLMMDGVASQDQLMELVLNQAMGAANTLTMVSGVITLLVLLIVYKVRRKSLGEAFWIRKVPARTLLAGPCMVPALYFAVTLVLSLLPMSWMQNYEEASSTLSDDIGILSFLSVVVVAPMVEEVVFRGLIMSRLSQVMRPVWAVVLSAVIFGACHGELVWFCYAFLLGMVFGLMDIKAGSILPSLAAHITFNLIGQIFTILSVTLPEGTYEVPAMITLVAAALILPFFNRRAISAVFTGPVMPPAAGQKEPIQLSRGSAGSRPMPMSIPVPAAGMAPMNEFWQNGTVTWCDVVFTADLWD